MLEKGFTLVELMIVIVIVGILSSVALPTFLSQRDKAKGTECVTKLGALLTGLATESIGDLTQAQVKTLLDAEAATETNNSICAYAIGAVPGSSSTTWTATATGDGTNLPATNIWNGCVNPANGNKDLVKSPASADCT